MKFLKLFLMMLITLTSSQYAFGTITNQTNISRNKFLTDLGFVKIPILQKGGLLYVQGEVDNHPVYFLLDTGSVSASLFSDGLTKLYLKSIQTKKKSSNMSGGVGIIKKVNLTSVNIMSIKMPTMSASIMEQPFQNNFPTVVVGNKFFEEYNAIIDIQEHVLFLNEHRILQEDRHTLDLLLKSQDYQKIPLTTLSSGQYILPIKINNALPVYSLFDTGTDETTLSKKYMKVLKINPINKFQNQKATNGVISISDIKINSITYNSLQLSFQKPITLYNRKIAAANISSLENILGVVAVVGLKDMEKLHAIIDVSAHSIYLKSH